MPGCLVRRRFAFTLIELLVVVAVIGALVGILLPSLSAARQTARAAVCLSNQRQIGLGARLYLDGNRGEFFHHHEGWVLDDGSQVDVLPATPDECSGGGMGNSHAEKPWVIFLQPYINSRKVGFCPLDPTPQSNVLASTLLEYNGGITSTDQTPPPESELAIAEAEGLTITSYLLNSVLSHRSCRYATEGVLRGFLTDTRAATLDNPNLIVFSERNSEAMNDPENAEYGSIGQDDYDTWAGEAALVRWGPSAGDFGDQGWIRYNRHGTAANYVYLDGHAQRRAWSDARYEQYPDRDVRRPLDDPPR